VPGAYSVDTAEFKQLARQMLAESVTRFQGEMDRLGRLYAGRPVEVIKPHVREALRLMDLRASEVQVTEYATAIARGSTVHASPSPV